MMYPEVENIGLYIVARIIVGYWYFCLFVHIFGFHSRDRSIANKELKCNELSN